MKYARTISFLIICLIVTLSLPSCPEPQGSTDPLDAIIPQTETAPPKMNTPLTPSENKNKAEEQGVAPLGPPTVSTREAGIRDLTSTDVCTRVMAHLYDFCDGQYRIGDDPFTKEQAVDKCRASAAAARDCFTACVEQVATKLDCPVMLPCIDECNSNFVPKVK